MDISKFSDYLDYEWAVTLNRATLKLFGVWPDDETEQRKLMLDLRVIFVLILIICSCIIPTIHALVRIWDDFILMVDNLHITLPVLMATLKFFIIWRKKRKLTPVLKMIKEDWIKLKTEKERNVMIRRARIGRIITIYGYFVMLISFIVAVILPSFGISLRYVTNKTDSGKPMPLQSYFMYDTNKSPSYEITFFVQGLGLMSTATMYTSIDNFLGFLIFHICGQLENLAAHILYLDENDLKNTLSHNVQDHRRLIRSIKIIDDTFTIMLFGLLFYFGLLFALYGFFFVSITKHGHVLSFARLGYMIVTFVTLFTHTCFYYIAGEVLVSQYDKFYKAACEYEWYKLTPKKARNLLILMIYAQKPLYLTAGIFPMTMATFCNVLKTSAGYISFLLTQSE